MGLLMQEAKKTVIPMAIAFILKLMFEEEPTSFLRMSLGRTMMVAIILKMSPDCPQSTLISLLPVKASTSRGIVMQLRLLLNSELVQTYPQMKNNFVVSRGRLMWISAGCK